MPTIPVRGVGDIGVISDLPSFDLPLKAWAEARNVRFRDGVITKAGAFKSLNVDIPLSDPPAAIVDGGAQGYFVVPKFSGVITQFVGPTITDVSPVVPWIPFTTKLTTCKVGGVTYLNNYDNKPLYKASPSSGVFNQLPGWPANDRAKSVRSFKDYVVAINITKASTPYPNMFKWSAAVTAGSPPADWDNLSLSSHAGENVLNDATGELVDGFPLGNAFILYGTKETYIVSFIGTPLIFGFDKLFDDLGILSQDCAIEIDGKHFVFGTNGIFIHDGQTKISISDRKVTKFIYSRLDQSKADRCFVYRNPTKQEVIFCYPSVGSECKWQLNDIDGCNEGAVYNVATGSWSFIDLPSAISSVPASMPAVPLWSDLGTWDSLSSAWRSFEGSEPPLPMVLSTGNPTLSADAFLSLYDDAQSGFLANPVSTDFVTSGWMETSLRDSDEFGGSLASTKLVRSIHPQIKVGSITDHVLISVGVASNPYEAPTWTSPQTFFPALAYKSDFRSTGRYVTLRFEIPANSEVQITGYDFDIAPIAMR